MTPSVLAMTDSRSIAGAVRAEAARSRVSGRALARHLQVAPDFLHRRLSGEVAFTGDELAAIARVLDIPIETFFQKVSA
jgi:hypothetical protein